MTSYSSHLSPRERASPVRARILNGCVAVADAEQGDPSAANLHDFPLFLRKLIGLCNADEFSHNLLRERSD